MKNSKGLIVLLSTVLYVMPVLAESIEEEPKGEDFDVLAAAKNEFEKIKTSDEPHLKAKVAYSPWFVNWQQTSTAATRFGGDAINVDYSIDGSIAHSARIEFELLGIGADLNLVELPKGAAGEGQALSYLSMGINYTELVGNTELHYRFEKGSFSGFINGADNAGNIGTGTFETDVVSHDIALLTKWGIGIGYRSFTYEVPQDVYLINTSTQALLQSGFVDMQYDADFLTLIFTHDELLNKDTAKFNMGLELRYGVGTMTPSGDFLDETQQALRDNGTDDNIIDDADATFLEFDVYAYMPLIKNATVDSEIRLGYRSDTLTANFSEDSGDYALVTDFETEFSGPYAAISAEF